MAAAAAEPPNEAQELATTNSFKLRLPPLYGDLQNLRNGNTSSLRARVFWTETIQNFWISRKEYSRNLQKRNSEQQQLKMANEVKQ